MVNLASLHCLIISSEGTKLNLDLCPFGLFSEVLNYKKKRLIYKDRRPLCLFHFNTEPSRYNIFTFTSHHVRSLSAPTHFIILAFLSLTHADLIVHESLQALDKFMLVLFINVLLPKKNIKKRTF